MGESLYTIIEHDIDGYIVKPDWIAVGERAKRVKKAFQDKVKKLGGMIACSIAHNFSNGGSVTSEREAIEVYEKECEKYTSKSLFGCYINGSGEFHLSSPLKVKAIIPGKSWYKKGEPATYIVYEQDSDHILECLDILIETCNFVLSQKDLNKNTYFLTWSG